MEIKKYVFIVFRTDIENRKRKFWFYLYQIYFPRNGANIITKWARYNRYNIKHDNEYIINLIKGILKNENK